MNDSTEVIDRTLVQLEHTVLVASQGNTQDNKEEQTKKARFKENKKQTGVGDCVKSRFELVDVLGIGGMGVVYRARDLRQKELGEKEPYLAFKVLNEQLNHNESALLALQQECKKTRKLAHPNIVNVYDFDREGDLVYMTMELLYGQSLDNIIFNVGYQGKSYQDVLPWVSEMCRALSYAHQNNIVHSDFKPSNVFITDSGTLKVFDFGIARAMSEADQTLENGLSALTPAYASLGMLQQKMPQAGDDLYALAIVIYMLLVGKHPYQKKNAQEVLENGLVPDRPKDMPDHAWKVLRKGLNPNTSNLSIEEFLTQFLPIKRNYNQLLVGAAVVLTLLMSGMLYLWINQRLEENNLVATLQEADFDQLAKTLAVINAFDEDRKDTVLARARDVLIERVIKNVGAKVEVGELALAKQRCQEYLQVYKDSQALWDLDLAINERIEIAETELLDKLQVLELALLSFSKAEVDQWFDLLDRLMAANPSHVALSQTQLLPKLLAAMHSAFYADRIVVTQQVLKNAQRYFPKNKEIKNIALKVKRYSFSDEATNGALSIEPKHSYAAIYTEDLNVKLEAFIDKESASANEVKQLLMDLETEDPQLAEAIRWSVSRHLKAQKDVRYRQWEKVWQGGE